MPIVASLVRGAGRNFVESKKVGVTLGARAYGNGEQWLALLRRDAPSSCMPVRASCSNERMRIVRSRRRAGAMPCRLHGKQIRRLRDRNMSSRIA
ncbi:hypothetical protein QZM22_19515 [Burkholderia oklahomensis]|uniref:hypothetical protein n=1 Tax=Burkholderia oklahomensis TaxID=342113 RepID=UPI0026540796|nr:hypothetical protein [Burkholderia oklahomensis]MDN7674656.1 hypothetical protein [Burkholderia oklahomensis]